DHPRGYASFEGTIPKGQYGGGTVKIWDRGTYEGLVDDERPGPHTVAEALDAGRLEFVIHGERLKGRFALVRMKARGRGKPQWLLIKSKDEFARPGEGGDQSGASPEPAHGRTRKAPLKPSDRPTPGKVELTHPGRVMFPEAGLTKE